MSIPASPLQESPKPPSKITASSILLKNASNLEDEKLAETIRQLEGQLEKELKIQEGAENLIKGLTKKKDREPVLKKLEECSKSVELIREKLAALNKKAFTRYGGGHSVTDLVDMIENLQLTDEQIKQRIEWVNEKIRLELKVKAGAENLAKVYGSGTDKKMMAEVFAKLMDSNAKINILKIALQKYKVRLEEPVSDPDKEQKFADDELKHWKRPTLTGKLTVKVIGARDLGPAHKKLDARCFIKVDSKVKAKTNVKQNTNKPVWNEEFQITLDSAGEIEFHIFDKTELYSLFFFEIQKYLDLPSFTEEMEYEMEPRGMLNLHISFVKKETVLKRRSKIGRRGAVRSSMPSAVVRFLGYGQTMEAKKFITKEQSMRKRAEKKPVEPKSPSDIVPDLEPTIHNSKPKKIPTMDDFVLHRVLGKGNFGKVMLVEEKETKRMYAIKVLKKEFIIENDEIESLKAEKRVFQIANRERHPFLVKLHSCFATEDRICFVMEYVSGGDLMLHIQRQLFSEARAKLYAAEVLLALEYLHKSNIVYRDLKLDNILLDLDGHIKIADYGLCKENMAYGKTTNTFCGTPEFMAPEILLEQDYGRAVDWWAFGVLIYEMLLAQSPFKGDEEEEIFDSILEGQVAYPPKLAPESVSILQQLLERDPKKRLGGGPDDAEEIKRHPFFKSFDWTAIYDKRVPIEYKPIIRDAKDTNNFDPEFTREAPGLTPLDSNLMDVDQEEFDGFSYVADWMNPNETAL